MITRAQIDELADHKPGAYPVTSVYLDTDSRRHTGGEYSKVLESLLIAKKVEVEQSEYSKDQQRWILQDFAKIQEFVTSKSRNETRRGLAVFSSAAAGLWQALPLPRAIPTQVIVDDVPYARPLLVLFDEFERFCAVVVDRRRGRIFDIFMGEIQEIGDIEDDVPKKTRGTGHLLKAETAVTRHIGEQWRAHYKNVADYALSAFRRQPFDRLVVGGPASDLSDFEKTLHSSLQQKIAGRISVQVGVESTPAEVLRQTREIEQALARDREFRLIESLLTQAHSGKLGTVGLADSLKALRGGQVHTLVLKDGLRVEGVFCSSCRFIGLGERECPTCSKPTRTTSDVVDLAVAEAMLQGCEVRHVFEASALDSVGSVGALLRFRA
ncbi:MAG: hypothetical protein HYR85_27750 [Planctomycetes bacterium]|nr:hypothetical protein [Planctomycetota bacterium]MBI3844224.1 hypothetical protein [Planctomycetota bacterium]